MKTLFVMLIFLPIEIFASSNCGIVDHLEGRLTSQDIKMLIKNNAQDPIPVICKEALVDLVKTADGFKIEKCFITACDDGSTFLCETGPLKVDGAKVFDQNNKAIGSCNNDTLSFEQDMDEMSWKNWKFKKSETGTSMKIDYNYWNLGTIESSVIPLSK